MQTTKTVVLFGDLKALNVLSLSWAIWECYSQSSGRWQKCGVQDICGIRSISGWETAGYLWLPETGRHL